MKEFPLFISFYTGDSYFHKCSDILKSDCEKIGIQIQIESVPDLGAYWKNTLNKPSFILKKLNEHKRDLIWIDVDTKISKYAECFKGWSKDLLVATHTEDLQGIKASPIGFKFNTNTLEFLKAWEKNCLDKIKNNQIDLDHDIMKYEILPIFCKKVSIEIMSGENKSSEFTNGSVIENGISRIPNKAREVQSVINQNKRRENPFKNLKLENFNG